GSTPRYVRFAVPEIFGLLSATQNFDRGTNSSSLHPSPTALGFVPTSIPLHKFNKNPAVIRNRETYCNTTKKFLQQFFSKTSFNSK
ncbi:MAG: hypothetical protein IKU23_07125, partial [Clostridia bacterium]|nr:hypothetical protein [Clostridia bacterium]